MAATLTLTSSITTSINIDETADFLSTVALPTDIDHQIVINCDINSAFQYVQLSYNKTDSDSGEDNPQDRYVMPDLYSRYVMYHQAKQYLKRQWAALNNDAGDSHESQVSDALQDLFDVGDKSTIQDETETASSHKLQMRLARVTSWITNFEDVYDSSTEQYSVDTNANNVFADASSVGTVVPPSQCYGGAVFSEAQLRELLDACSDAGRYEWQTDFPSTIPIAINEDGAPVYGESLVSGRRLKLNDGDKLAVKVIVTQKDNSTATTDTENKATWLVVLQQDSDANTITLDPQSLTSLEVVPTSSDSAGQAFLRFVNGQDSA